MRVLVAYGSKEGGTKGLAEMVGSEFAGLGYEVEVHSGDQVEDVSSFEVVIVGAAVYYFVSWHKDAKAFIKRYTNELKQKPVWLFSSGPLDDSATEKDIPPIKPARKLIERIGARGHVTFGGRMEKNQKGYAVGDWRDPEHVKRWVGAVHAELTGGGS